MRIEFTKKMSSALRKLRGAAHLSQYDLAQAAKAPRASIKRWECFEVKTIDADVLGRLETVLGAPLSAVVPKVKSPTAVPEESSASSKIAGTLRGQGLGAGFGFLSMKPLLERDAKNLKYFEVVFDADVDADTLFGPVRLCDASETVVVSGTVNGVECSAEGVKAGDSVVLAIWTGN